MEYEEKISSIIIELQLLTFGSLFTSLPCAFIFFAIDQGASIDSIFRNLLNDPRSAFTILVILFGLLSFFTFGIAYLYKAFKQFRANGKWIARVSNGKIQFLSPDHSLGTSVSIELSNLKKIEKKIKDKGDNDEAIEWTFITTEHNILLDEQLGFIFDLEKLASFISVNFAVKVRVRRFTYYGKEI